MRFTLIDVVREENGVVSGYWNMNHTGTLETATTWARETERLNRNSNVAVVADIGRTNPIGDFITNLKRLD
jgi:hypothetical protein